MDDSVFNRLYDQYHNDVFRFLIYLIRDRDQAEDLMHEVYVRVLRAYSGFQGKSSEKTWLFSIAKNVAIDHYRKNSVRRKHSLDKFDWEKSELVSPEILPDSLVVLNEEMKELLAVLDTCTGDQKMVIHMRFIHDLSISETAEILGWSEGKVKTTQHRAVNALRKKLSR
ncbi:RNA polymerase sigma factor SigX [Sporosarcina jiandibaonis]|uniref:RNA polymerase sigma factor SigX n=1 Tax=Sporosarcina jiandibaonis TaxID=2715535 RepID=UPI001557AB4E|nr:RNA polymerase sigma factor SigX [Sporosarcina jiandibaonis]